MKNTSKGVDFHLAALLPSANLKQPTANERGFSSQGCETLLKKGLDNLQKDGYQFHYTCKNILNNIPLEQENILFKEAVRSQAYLQGDCFHCKSYNNKPFLGDLTILYLLEKVNPSQRKLQHPLLLYFNVDLPNNKCSTCQKTLIEIVLENSLLKILETFCEWVVKRLKISKVSRQELKQQKQSESDEEDNCSNRSYIQEIESEDTHNLEECKGKIKQSLIDMEYYGYDFRYTSEVFKETYQEEENSLRVRKFGKVFQIGGSCNLKFYCTNCKSPYVWTTRKGTFRIKFKIEHLYVKNKFHQKKNSQTHNQNGQQETFIVNEPLRLESTNQSLPLSVQNYQQTQGQVKQQEFEKKTHPVQTLPVKIKNQEKNTKQNQQTTLLIEKKQEKKDTFKTQNKVIEKLQKVEKIEKVENKKIVFQNVSVSQVKESKFEHSTQPNVKVVNITKAEQKRIQKKFEKKSHCFLVEHEEIDSQNKSFLIQRQLTRQKQFTKVFQNDSKRYKYPFMISFNIKIFRQMCKFCKRFSEGQIYDSDLSHYQSKMCQIIAGILDNVRPPKIDRNRKGIRKQHLIKHQKEFCQACMEGTCGMVQQSQREEILEKDV